MAKDYQRSKVYAWENAAVGPRCPGVVAFEQAQQYVNGVWLANGWQRPPKVIPLAKRSKHLGLACGCGEIYLPCQVPAWVILHELAHSLTDDLHGPDFVGMYIDLLERVEKLSRLETMFSLKAAGVDFNLGVKPLAWVVDKRQP